MNTKGMAFPAAVFASMFSFAAISEAQTVNTQALSPKQRSIVTISAFTANGDLEKLKTALNTGLDAGLTINEIKEILVQMYAYAGFPRSLNGINTFMAVMDERQKRGIKDEMGKEASPLPADMNKNEYGARVRAKLAGQEVIPPPGGYQLFTPVIDAFLKEHLFTDIFARDNLDYQGRELATISALASMTGTAGQLRFHLGAAMNMGLTETQMKDFISVLEARVGRKEAESAHEILSKVLGDRQAEQSATPRASTRAATKEATGVKIRLRVENKMITATLIDNKTTRDFISLLPLTLTMNDLFRREKYAHLPRAISEEGKRTHTYEVGDVAYWPPGPDVAIFYHHDGQNIPDPGVIVIGKIDSGVEALNVSGPVKVTIEHAKEH